MKEGELSEAEKAEAMRNTGDRYGHLTESIEGMRRAANDTVEADFNSMMSGFDTAFAKRIYGSNGSINARSSGREICSYRNKWNGKT